MKRILKLFLLTFVMLFLSCIFFSCKLTNINAAENAILVNNSSVDIKIQIGQTTYDISHNSTSSCRMSWTDSILITNKERVTFKKYYDYKNASILTVVFSDMEKYEYAVENKLNEDITLFEQSGFLGSKFGEGFRIAKNASGMLILYTKNPNLVAMFQVTEKTSCIAELPNTFVGKTISKIENFYLSNLSSKDISVSTTGWNNSAAITLDKPFLWHYLKISFSDASEMFTSKPVIIARCAEDGMDISDIIPSFTLANTKESEPTPFLALTSEKVLEEGNLFLWKKQRYKNCIQAGKVRIDFENQKIIIEDFAAIP